MRRAARLDEFILPPGSRMYGYEHQVPASLWGRDSTAEIVRRLAVEVMRREAAAQGFILDPGTVHPGPVTAVLAGGAEVSPDDEHAGRTLRYRVPYTATGHPALIPGAGMRRDHLARLDGGDEPTPGR